ncbi:MAG: glutamine--fructose-6-phosphate transaminase (isomerizing) [Deltaproteobacteria bacterium]|nr:glutamine--fructose-6-phosphate transaminase (isomerizing) [Deltaproteobacteria bacterium]
MCGIVGYVGPERAEPILVEGLSRLEYRGYDSAGIATLDGTKSYVRRAAGKLAQLRARLQAEPCPGSVGIGHTRWATHGRPSEGNAHPHTSNGVTVVHNGIIENHRELRDELRRDGRLFTSETDTEIFAHLIAVARAQGADLLQAIRAATSCVRGAYALAVIDEATPGAIGFAKLASPLVVGLGEGESFLASDVPAVLSHTRRFIFLEDGDVGVVRAEGAQLFDGKTGRSVERAHRTITWSAVMAEKGGHKHFMHKEIHEQPRAITDTLRGRILLDDGKVALDGIDEAQLKGVERVLITACGTSWHAALVGKYLVEKLAHVSCDVELASELRYREPVVTAGTLVVAISQSGETADTLAALKECRRLGACVLCICNVVDAAIPRACEGSVGTLYTRAGPEIGVASTKAFTTQLVALHLLAIGLGQARGALTTTTARSEMEALARLPLEMERCLAHEADTVKLAQQHMGARDMLYLGRGHTFPIALEGALKLKEISYIHAEGYAAGEMKHGPIALIDEHMPVIVLALRGPGYEKVLSNLEEVRARGGRVIAVGTEDDAELSQHAEAVLRIPAAHPHTTPALAVIPLQLFAYHVADLRGTDVDQPRNLAKSVTVE